MDNRVNYTLVGLFVVLMTTLIITTIFWLTTRGTHVEHETYVAYMRESVAGLNPRAAVKYRGVGVGFVRKISLDKKNPERVKLLLDIETGTPVKEDTLAVLTTQGITGLAFVDLTGGNKESPALKLKEGEKYPEIKTGASLMLRVDKALTNLVTGFGQTAKQVSQVADRLNQVLNDDQQKSLSKSLQNIELITNALAQSASNINDNLKSMEKILNNTALASNNLPTIMQEATQSVSKVNQTLDNINQTTLSVKQLVTTTEDDLGRLTNETLPQIRPLLTNLKALSTDMRRLTLDLQRDPNALLFGRQRQIKGPGE